MTRDNFSFRVYEIDRHKMSDYGKQFTCSQRTERIKTCTILVFDKRIKSDIKAATQNLNTKFLPEMGHIGSDKWQINTNSNYKWSN